jgi:hypothetical protein
VLAISLQRRDPLLEQIVDFGDAVFDERMESPQLGVKPSQPRAPTIPDAH